MANVNKIDVKQLAQDALVQLKKYGYVSGMLMVALGVIVFLRPFAASTAFLWMMVFGLLVNGFSKFFMYFKLPKEMRNGWVLALGILWVICAILILTDLFNMPLQTTISLQAFVGIVIGFNCIFSGVNSICSSGRVAELGGSKGLTIVSGIIELICGGLVLSSPLMGLFAITIAFGLYLTVMGVCTIIRCIAY